MVLIEINMSLTICWFCLFYEDNPGVSQLRIIVESNYWSLF
jgi:hypothetical protein